MRILQKAGVHGVKKGATTLLLMSAVVLSWPMDCAAGDEKKGRFKLSITAKPLSGDEATKSDGGIGIDLKLRVGPVESSKRDEQKERKANGSVGRGAGKTFDPKEQAAPDNGKAKEAGPRKQECDGSSKQRDGQEQGAVDEGGQVPKGTGDNKRRGAKGKDCDGKEPKEAKVENRPLPDWSVDPQKVGDRAGKALDDVQERVQSGLDRTIGNMDKMRGQLGPRPKPFEDEDANTSPLFPFPKVGE